MLERRPVTAQEIVDILFQEPHRITKDVMAERYSPNVRSFGRAQDELVESGLFNDVQLDQILESYNMIATSVLMSYMMGEISKTPYTPEAWDDAAFIEIDFDKTAFLGLRVKFDYVSKPAQIAEGNPAAKAIRDSMLAHLEFFFPHPVYLRPDDETPFSEHTHD